MMFILFIIGLTYVIQDFLVIQKDLDFGISLGLDFFT